MANMNFMLLGVLLLICILGGLAASPVAGRPRVQGGGRAEQGQAYSLTCVVEGLPGTETTSSYVWYKNGDIIRDKTRQALRFPKLTPGDAGMYQCLWMLAHRPRLLSKPVQLNVKAADPPSPHSPFSSTQDDRGVRPDSYKESWFWGVSIPLAALWLLSIVIYSRCRNRG